MTAVNETGVAYPEPRGHLMLERCVASSDPAARAIPAHHAFPVRRQTL